MKLLTNKSASETMLNDLVRDQERGSVGLSDPFAKAAKVPLVDHIVSFELHLEAEGYNPFDKKQTPSRVRKALVDGCKFSRLLAGDSEKLTAWLSSKRKASARKDLPECRDEFTVKEASTILGVGVHAVHAAIKRLDHAPGHRGKRTILTRETVQKLLDRRSKGMSQQTAVTSRRWSSSARGW